MCWVAGPQQATTVAKSQLAHGAHRFPSNFPKMSGLGLLPKIMSCGICFKKPYLRNNQEKRKESRGDRPAYQKSHVRQPQIDPGKRLRDGCPPSTMQRKPCELAKGPAPVHDKFIFIKLGLLSKITRESGTVEESTHNVAKPSAKLPSARIKTSVVFLVFSNILRAICFQ